MKKGRPVLVYDLMESSVNALVKAGKSKNRSASPGIGFPM